MEERSKKTKTRAENVENISEWSQEQQRALEAALIKYPKGTSADRWEKIANCVEGKSKVLYKIFYIAFLFFKYICYNRYNVLKDECQARYRQLVELVKKKQHTQ